MGVQGHVQMYFCMTQHAIIVKKKSMKSRFEQMLLQLEIEQFLLTEWYTERGITICILLLGLEI